MDFTCAVTNSSIPSVRVSEESCSNQFDESACAEIQQLKAGVQVGSRESIDEAPKSTTRHCNGVQPVDDDVLYDKPIISHGKPASGGEKDSDDVNLEGVDPSTLFDDPGYTEGLRIIQGSQPSTEPEVDESTNTGSISMQTSVPQLQRVQSKDPELEPGRVAETQSLSLQLGKVPGMKSSINSLQLLNFDDSELEELDPVVASCLRTPILSDTDDEIAISEV